MKHILKSLATYAVRLPQAIIFTTVWGLVHVKASAQIPEIGAQIWLEPGQSKQDIDTWFLRLKEHHMPVTRIFIQWNFIETAPDKWDFTLFDAAFDAAERHGVGIVATLMPNFPPAHRGGWYKTQDGAIAKTQAQLQESFTYIEKVVNRYKVRRALHTWMLMNEPGQLPSPDSLAMHRFRQHLKHKYQRIETLNAAWLSSFKNFDQIQYSPNWSGGGFTWPVSYIEWNTFWREHLAWYLQQIALEIKKHDDKHPIHVNPHALLDILPKYDLPQWRQFLSHLGASIHPVWHFNDLNRQQYAFGVSWVCDLVRGASEPNPFWTTELQGGHNIYSADVNLQPRNEEIAAWLWTSIASGAQKTIFWCLNPRNKGTEAGEWSMLDYLHQATDRLKTAGMVAEVVKSHADFFENAKPLADDVSIIISLETLTLQERARRKDQNHLGRGHKTHYFASMACYRALQEQGWQPQVKHIHDYDWLAKTAKPRVAILADAEALTDEQIQQLEGFVANGNHLIVLGNTGFYDEQEEARPHTGRFMHRLVGGHLSELSEAHEISLTLNKPYQLPVAGYAGRIHPTSGKPITNTAQEVVALSHQLGKGSVFWLPAKVDVAAWFTPTPSFNQLLHQQVYKHIVPQAPLEVVNGKQLLTKHLQYRHDLVSIFHLPQANNHNGKKLHTFKIKTQQNFDAQVIFGDKSAFDAKSQTLTLQNQQTIVILWKAKL